jgi:hypothetical protein
VLILIGLSRPAAAQRPKQINLTGQLIQPIVDQLLARGEELSLGIK